MTCVADPQRRTRGTLAEAMAGQDPRPLYAPETGRILAGRYQLIEPLGRGGMGAVWLAQHVTLNSLCAVKLMDPSLAYDPASAARFKREAQAAAALRTPHVVQIMDFGVDDGTPYLVMERLEGESLGARLRRLRKLEFSSVAKIVAETARGLGKVHDLRMVHRDIKPDNIFLAQVDNTEVTKVLDFGIAKVATSSGLTKPGAVLGTPQYMSPEQVEGRPIDHRSDLWALATVAFESVVGVAPFKADTVSDLVLQICVRPLPVPSRLGPVAAGFDAWFARGVSRDPAERFQTARAMADALEDLGWSGHGFAATLPASNQPSHWSAGDDRAGFDMRADVLTRTLHLRLWGLWDQALEAPWRSSVLAGYARFEGRPFVILSDVTRWVPQKPEMQAMHKETMKSGFEMGLTRVGVVVNSALTQMQIRRLFEEAGSPPNVRFTDDPREARAWIGR